MYLAYERFLYSITTHKYMSSVLELKSIIQPQKPKYKSKKAHTIFENRIQQEFRGEKVNQKWCINIKKFDIIVPFLIYMTEMSLLV